MRFARVRLRRIVGRVKGRIGEGDGVYMVRPLRGFGIREKWFRMVMAYDVLDRCGGACAL